MRRYLPILTLLVAVLVPVTGTPLAAQVGTLPDPPFTFVGQATSTGSVISGASRLQITIQRWSTPQETAQLRDSFGELGQAGVVGALDSFEQAGFIRTGTGVGDPLQFATAERTEDGWFVLIATTRPIAAVESYFNLRSMEFPLLVVELQLDVDGNGEGAIAAGAQLYRDSLTGRLMVQRRDTQPVLLRSVRIR